MFPECWKCVSAELQEAPLDAPYRFISELKELTLVGCKECNRIKSYPDAFAHCPLLKE